MKTFCLILMIASTAIAQTFEPLGQPCRAFNVLASRVVKDAAGKEWFVLSNTNETTGVELIFIDWTTNTAKKYPAPAGQGAWMLNRVAGDRLIVGTYYDGKMMVFDLKSMSFTKVIPFKGEEYFWNAALGSDGRLYGGTYPGAKLGALNLDTLELEDCGAPAAPNLYLRNVSPTPDGRLLCNFVTAKQTTKLFDPKTKEWSDVPASVKHVQRAVVWNDHLLSIGAWDGSGKAQGAIAFKGENFDPVDPPPFPIPPDDENTWSVDANLTTPDTLYIHRGNARFRLGKFDSKLTKVFEQDLRSGAITATASDGTLLGIRGQDYLYVATGKTQAELRPIPVEASPRPMHFIKVDGKNRLWGGPIFGQTLFWMDLATEQFTNTGIVCNAGGEVYDVAFGDGKVYAVAYAGGDIVEYDPNEPWDQMGGKNPRSLTRLGDRGYIRPVGGVVLASDGKLYSGWMAKYGTYGGALAITDPRNGDTKLVENPLGEQAISGLALDENFIYVGTSLAGNGLPHKPNAQPQFGILDRTTHKVVHQQSLGASEVSRIFLDKKTNQLAIIVDNKLKLFDLKTHALKDTPQEVAAITITAHAADTRGGGEIVFASGKTVVRLDLATRALQKTEAPAKIDHLCLSPDGKTVFLTIGPDLYRVTP